MEYFLGEVEYSNGRIEYRLIQAETSKEAIDKLHFVYGGYAKSLKIRKTL